MDETAMTDSEVAARILRECKTGDLEADHLLADKLIVELLTALGFTQTVDAWDSVEKWYA